MANTIKTKITGTVKTSFYDKENHKMSIGIGISPEFADWFTNYLQEHGMEWSGENYPVKEQEDGSLIFKTSTSFIPDLLGIAEEDFHVLGAGSEVTVYVQCKEGKYGRKKYVTGYLVGLDVHHFVEYVKREVFEDDEFENPFYSQE